MDWRDVLLAVACLTASLVFAGTIFAFRAAQSVVRYSPYPYLSTVLTSGLLLMYAIDWALVPLGWLSAMGVILGIVYLVLFLWHSDTADLRLTYLLCYAAGGVPLFIAAITFNYYVPKTTFYGILCCAASCAASVAPAYYVYYCMFYLPRAFREKKMDCMPSIFIPGFTLPSAFFWTTRNLTLGGGWRQVDYSLVIASVVAGLSALGQLLMHRQFRTQPHPPPPGSLLEPLVVNNQNAAGDAVNGQDGGGLDPPVQQQGIAAVDVPPGVAP